MSQPRRMLTRATAAALLVLAASLAPAGRPAATALECAAASQDPRPTCCFENPRYVGTCEVEPTGDETCASVLEYLNNPQSTGKNYCSSTAIRGGWKSVSCESKTKTD
jgi:hypothetical protein